MKNKNNKNNKSKKNKSLIIIFAMILVSILVAKPILKNINYGLDLKGGFEVLYEVSPLNDKDSLTKDMMNTTYKAIVKRIDTLGVSEPEITIEDNKIRVQLPGVKDEESARKRLSKPAVLSFRDSNDKVLMTAEVLGSPGAKLNFKNSTPVVGLSVKDVDLFYNVTKEVSESSDQMMVIWLDFEEGKDSYENVRGKCGTGENNCISEATVKEAFASDVIIEGHFSNEEANTLVDLINSGSLPTKITEISTKTVDAAFGANTLSVAAIAGVVTLILITIIMTIIYRKSGLISSICLIFYSLIVFGIFNLFDGVLTLTGIAALILGIGMAVDSSIVTLEKIKDELRKGSNIYVAFKEANKKSLVSLIDANITTLIVAVILYMLGVSSVKGFGLMLIVTIVVTMITMVFINRVVLGGFVNKNTNVKAFIGNVKPLKERNFMKHFNKALILIGVLIISLIVSIVTKRINFGIDFIGGSNITLKSENGIDNDFVNETIDNFKVEKLEKVNNNEINILLNKSLNDDEIKDLKNKFDEKEYNSDITVISNIVKKDLTKNAIKSIIIAFICILVYISFRFKFTYGLASICAILIDLLSVISLFALFKIKINYVFIASLLTIIGYSINDTIIIFDLIRENKKNNKSEPNLNIVNKSLSKAFSRSVLTTITTLISVVILLVFGASEIREFNLAILIGLTSGLITSLIVAPRLWIFFDKHIKFDDSDFDDGPQEKIIKGINA